MSEKPPEFVRKSFPRMWYFPDYRLLAWHPLGVLDDAFADKVIEFVETEERIQKEPFNRYTDFSGLTDIRLKVDHFFDFGERRRKAAQQVKSAFFADKPVSFFISRMYAMIMEKGLIEVRVFEKREAAAEWLEVPIKVLEPPA